MWIDERSSVDMESDESPVSSTGWNSSRSSASSIRPPKVMEAVESFFMERGLGEVAREEKEEGKDRQRTALERLGKELGEVKRAYGRSERKRERDRQREAKEQAKLRKERAQALEDCKEAEGLMEAMREETEKVMSELNESQGRAEEYRRRAERLERDLLEGKDPEEGLLREARIRTEGLKREMEDRAMEWREREKGLEDQVKALMYRHQLQVAALSSEKEELRQRLVKAEQRSSENAQGWEAERKKKKGEPELEDALRRSVAEKEKELALLKSRLEKTERTMERTESVYEQRLERELTGHRAALEDRLEQEYRQRTDSFQVEVSRELRQLGCQMADLELELESAERENANQQKAVYALQAGASSLEEMSVGSVKKWQTIEKELQTTIAELHIQVASLEKESLVLYSKNLELAHQLGELEP